MEHDQSYEEYQSERYGGEDEGRANLQAEGEAEQGIMACKPHIMRRAKTWLLRKLFIKLGYSKILGKAFELQIINSKQLHHLDAMFKHYEGAPDYHRTPCA